MEKILKQQEIGQLALSLCQYAMSNGNVEASITFGKRYGSDVRIEIRDTDTFQKLSESSYLLDDVIGAELAMVAIIKEVEENKQKQ